MIGQVQKYQAARLFVYEQAALDCVFTGNCVGHFWDNVKKEAVSINLGYVVLRPVNSFRAAPFFALDTSGQKNLSRGEGAAPCEFHGAETSERGTAAPPTRHHEKSGQYPTNLKGQKSPGTSVIPGQVATGCQKC